MGGLLGWEPAAAFVVSHETPWTLDVLHLDKI